VLLQEVQLHVLLSVVLLDEQLVEVVVTLTHVQLLVVLTYDGGSPKHSSTY
jgi:hypothetical protein